MLWKNNKPRENNDSPLLPEVPPEEEADREDVSSGIAEYRDRLARLAAEFENYRRRTQRDIEFARRHERHGVLLAFLDVLDNFERALVAEGAEGNSWIEGLEGIHRQMLDTFARFGARPDNPVGVVFDPQRHEAVAVAHLPGMEPDTIAEVIQTGYVMDEGEVLRPAKVVVAK